MSLKVFNLYVCVSFAIDYHLTTIFLSFFASTAHTMLCCKLIRAYDEANFNDFVPSDVVVVDNIKSKWERQMQAYTKIMNTSTRTSVRINSNLSSSTQHKHTLHHDSLSHFLVKIMMCG